MLNKMKLAARAAAAVVRNELAPGESGWVNLTAPAGLPTHGHASAAGKVVSGETAMKISAVWDCVRTTAQTISTLPLGLYERNRDGSKTRLENDLDAVLTVMPNRDQTAQEFWEGMTAGTVLQGNGCAEKLMIGDRLVGLRPMLNCRPRIARTGGLEYEVLDRGKRYLLPAEKVFHMRGFGAGDGLGLSAIKYGAQSMGAALAADESAGKVFSNGMMASGVVHTDQTLDEKQRAQLQAMLEAYTGSTKAGKVMSLEAGLKYSQLQLNPDDAQLLETRKFQVEDVCRWFGVPPIIIGHASGGQTMWGSGVEAIMLSWLTLGINPQLRRIEARALVDLVPPSKRRRWTIEFDREAMLQMDSKAKGEFLAKMATSGTMSANERRAKLNLPRHPDPAADNLMMQGAMALLENLGEKTDA
jgi:HK97 family phage portal protein